jgi:uncharacterized protein YceH (UPF0502 family)
MSDSAVLEMVAKTARARVEDMLKSTVERELVVMEDMAAPRHSKFEHVVAEVHNAAAADREDQSLANSMWGSEKEDRIRAFADRLANLKAS